MGKDLVWVLAWVPPELWALSVPTLAADALWAGSYPWPAGPCRRLSVHLRRRCWIVERLPKHLSLRVSMCFSPPPHHVHRSGKGRERTGHPLLTRGEMKFGGMEMMSPKHQWKYCRAINGTRNLHWLWLTYSPIIGHNLGSLGEVEILTDRAQRNKGGWGVNLSGPLTVPIFSDHTPTSLSHCLPNYRKGVALLKRFIKKW